MDQCILQKPRKLVPTNKNTFTVLSKPMVALTLSIPLFITQPAPVHLTPWAMHVHTAPWKYYHTEKYHWYLSTRIRHATKYVL